MSIIKIDPERFDYFKLKTHPKRTYTSSSSGITGSASVYGRSELPVKEVENFVSNNEVAYVDNSLQNNIVDIKETIKEDITVGLTNINSSLENYLTIINDTNLSLKRQKKKFIDRKTISFNTDNSLMLKTLLPFQVIKNNLFNAYRTRYNNLDYGIKNYHCLNFVTGGNLPIDAAIIYPDPTGSSGINRYSTNKAFTLSFYINPRYDNVSSDQHFNAGTIFHVSSSIAVSLLSGSQTDENGLVNSYRIGVQLGHSADTKPSLIDDSIANNARSYPDDLIFLSSDNLHKNQWHHVAIRWGTDSVNLGSGSILIDNIERGLFVVPSSSTDYTPDSNVVVIGNYLETSDSPIKFFNASVSATEGIEQLEGGSADPTAIFQHPLNAEIHDIRLHNEYLDTQKILTSSLQGLTSVEDSNLSFYLPPFFTRESNKRTVIKSNFYSSTSTETNNFHNEFFALGVQGYDCNVENMVREFKVGKYPRLYSLTASNNTVGTSTSGQTAQSLYNQINTNLARNNLIQPNDNGKFIPGFTLLESGSITSYYSSGSEIEKFRSDLDNINLQNISLRDLVPVLSSSYYLNSSSYDYNPTPNTLDDPINALNILAFPISLANTDSNLGIIFEIPKIFYGERIFPGTFVLSETGISGSESTRNVIIKDDKKGSLFRADSSTSHAEWNSVGNIFYDEGIVLIKHPAYSSLGINSFDIEFKGESTSNVMTVSAISPANQINSSSNPVYKKVNDTNDTSDEDKEFVYITSINLHDENLNVVGRANLSQPIKKKNSEKILFRYKIDW
jgi:hypothetical protein